MRGQLTLNYKLPWLPFSLTSKPIEWGEESTEFRRLALCENDSPASLVTRNPRSTDPRWDCVLAAPVSPDATAHGWTEKPFFFITLAYISSTFIDFLERSRLSFNSNGTGGGGKGELACRFSGLGEPKTDVWLAILNVEAINDNIERKKGF